MKISKILVIAMLIMVLSISIAYAEDRVSLGFLYGSTADLSLIDRTNGSINQVSPTCLDLDNKGNLVVTGNLTHTFVDAMHERGILVTPFLSNHWARQKGRKAIENANVLASQVVATINEYDLDGVNVDIENLTEDDRDNLSEFIKVLREWMPEGKLLTVSVAANPWGRDDGWQGSYDYEKIGQYADYILLMAYDEHSIGGPEGPVASAPFVEGSIQYALNYIPNDKIVLGIPFFGRMWKEYFDEEGNVTLKGGDAVVIGNAPTLIAKYDGFVEYPEDLQEEKVFFVVNNEEMDPSSLNGKQLENGNYVLWYPSHDSIKYKLELVNKYNLLGAGVWALGQEKVDVWEYFSEELNKTPRVPEEIEMIEEYQVYEAYKEMLKLDIDPNEEFERIYVNNKIIEAVKFFEENAKEGKAPHLHIKFIDSVDKGDTEENKNDKNSNVKKVYKIKKESNKMRKIRRKKYEKIY